MTRVWLSLLLMLTLPIPCWAAAPLHGRVTIGGRAAAFAVVAVDAPTPPAAPQAVKLDEVWLSFYPKVQVVPPGSTLLLANHDEESHTVHAYLNGQTLFNRASVPGEATQRLLLPSAGVVSIVCDLHPAMSAFVLVDKARHYAISDSNGDFHFDTLPAGNYPLRVWHRRPGINHNDRWDARPAVAVPSDAPLLIDLAADAQLVPSLQPQSLPPSPPSPLPAWLRRLNEVNTQWPKTPRLAWWLSVVALLGGLALAKLNLRIAELRRFAKSTALLIGCGLAFLAGISVLLGLHGAVASALGFGLFVGTVIFLSG